MVFLVDFLVDFLVVGLDGLTVFFDVGLGGFFVVLAAATVGENSFGKPAISATPEILPFKILRRLELSITFPMASYVC